MTNRRAGAPTGGGISLRLRFSLAMSIALALVMAVAGYLLNREVTKAAAAAFDRRVGEAVTLTATEGRKGNYEQVGDEAIVVPGTGVMRFSARYGLLDGRSEPAEIYSGKSADGETVMHLLVPDDSGRSGRGLFDLVLGITALVIAVGAFVSLIVAGSVAKPIEALVDDVRQVARGNFMHRTHVKVGGEVRALAREIDKMAANLKDAQDAELDLLAKEREMQVADEVRESLLPEGTPDVVGYDLQALQVGCPTPGGDFYDVFEYEDGRVGLLLCEVSGSGIPGALIGAAARAYLTSILPLSADVTEGLRVINRHLAKGVRRGMYVTAMYALLDPKSGEIELACAGHRVPALHFVAADGKLRTSQPEGIALGFDRGPVFDRTLQTSELNLAPGDRLVLSNTGPLQVQDDEGNELGEKGLYRLLAKRAFESSDELLGTLDGALDAYAGERDFPHDISVITIRREGQEA